MVGKSNSGGVAASKTQGREEVKGGIMFQRWTRDTAIITVALALMTYEIIQGGGRPAVLTTLTSLLLSPLVIRIDESRRNGNGKGGGDDDS